MNLTRFETLDPNLLPGLANTALRNDCEDLHDLLRTHDLDEEQFLARMREIGYEYCPTSNQFRPHAPGTADVPVGPEARGADGDVGAPGNPLPGESDSREWYSRGYLPHRNAPGVVQSITFRLADSLPRHKLALLEEELERLPETEREAEHRRRIEDWLDAGMGCGALRRPEVAKFVQDSILHFHGDRYLLHAWCIMPNHVHVLVEPRVDLPSIVQGWKSYTARWILKQKQPLSLAIPDEHRVWARDYWDRYIRDGCHYRSAVDYIQQNPVKARLCQTPKDWPWSSAHPGTADVPVGPEARGGARGASKADGDVGGPG